MYSFMDDGLFSLAVTFGDKVFSGIWSKIETADAPAKNLFNYGFSITDSANIVLYGGLTVDGTCTRMKKSFLKHADLWMINP
jgi:hypothetical protein